MCSLYCECGNQRRVLSSHKKKSSSTRLMLILPVTVSSLLFDTLPASLVSALHVQQNDTISSFVQQTNIGRKFKSRKRKCKKKIIKKYKKKEREKEYFKVYVLMPTRKAKIVLLSHPAASWPWPFDTYPRY